ncbi:MAG TPA: ABC transporter permease [Gemmatimonadaceae bacterium]|nr:ABC transporter permease [Gemmatimonadaceae bacterium]
MRFFRRVLYWLRFRAEQDDLREEIAQHRALVAAEFERRGLTADAARDAARRAMGNETSMREQARGVWLAPRLDAFLQDWRYSWRGLRHSPAFTLVAVTSLAVGIGANAAVFGLLDGLLLARVPVPSASQLIHLKRDLGPDGVDDRFSRSEFNALAAGPVSLAMFGSTFAPVEIDGVGANASTDVIDGRYFGVTGLRAERGRLISPADDEAAAPVVVLTDRFWRGRMNGDPNVIGKTITISGQRFSVIGVTPSGFAGLRFPAFAALFIPYRSAATLGVLAGANDRRQGLTVFGRLGASQSLEGAQGQLRALWDHCCAMGQLFTPAKGQTVVAARLVLDDVSRGIPHPKMDLRGMFGRVLWALMAGVGLLLLAACANVANLLLARGSARTGELAMRLALGASRARLAGQLVIESLQLSLLGAAAGGLLAWWGTKYLTAEHVGDLAMVVQPSVGPAVFLFTTVVSVASALAFGVAPAAHLVRGDLLSPLSQAGRRAVPGRRGVLDRGLVALQVALAVLLVSGATLLVQTLRNLQDTKLGFEPAQRLAITVETRATSYARQAMTAQMANEMLRRIRGIPGVRTAAFASLVPVYGGRTMTDNVTVPGAQAPSDGASTLFVGVTPDYFESLGMPLLTGHDIGPPVATLPRGAIRDVVVNDLFVKKFFGDRNPVGQVFRDADDGDTTFTEDRIVGVVAAAKFADARSPARPMYFVPINDGDWPFLVLVMRSSVDATIAASAGRTISAIAPGIGRGEPTSLAASIDAALTRERIAATLATLFGIIALSLVAVGLYGVMLYQVAARTTEIGIRVALGASPSAVVGLVLRQSLAIVAIGLAAGVPLALLAGRAVSSQLYGIQPYSLSALGVATIALFGVALAACLVPARRAVRIDPLAALRAS